MRHRFSTDLPVPFECLVLRLSRSGSSFSVIVEATRQYASREHAVAFAANVTGADMLTILRPCTPGFSIWHLGETL
jgi:hypothetical protein